MAYLARLNPPIVHRDLRSPNVLLVSLLEDTPVRAKVGDFGLSRVVAHEIVGALHTWQWHAPEVIMSMQEAYDESADIYSFAIVCWELATRKYPFEEFADDPRFCGNDISLKRAVVEEDLRPSLPCEREQCPPEFAQLIVSCWQRNPRDRPRFPSIVTRLEQMVPFKPTLSSMSIKRASPANLLQRQQSSELKSRVEMMVFSTRVAQISCKQLGISSLVRCVVELDGKSWIACSDGSILVVDAKVRTTAATLRSPSHTHTQAY